ncbi:MAG: uncharacterized protein KVP18_005037 [Porospora cf. gigantea A]|uniref:uncharacterized protein n=1 Tax=Porospora cf. gigantea A TaxID=2853593 RepID=UPI0035596014|nr:MAG: hypothetical protein KVP18_005037 [Porospora cf. gigantea A]
MRPSDRNYTIRTELLILEVNQFFGVTVIKPAPSAIAVESPFCDIHKRVDVPGGVKISFTAFVSEGCNGCLRRGNLIATALEPDYARRLWPVPEGADCRARMSLTILCREPDRPVWSADEISHKRETFETAAILQRFQNPRLHLGYRLLNLFVTQFQPTPLLPLYATGLFLGPWIVAQEWEVDGVRLRILLQDSWAVPEFTSTFLTWAFRKVQQLFSPCYPLSTLNFIGYDNHRGLALENFGCISMESGCLLPQQPFDLRLVRLYLHEISHLWMGDMVTMTCLGSHWLKEGSARLIEYELLLDVPGPVSLTHDDIRSAFLLEVCFEAMLKDGLPHSGHPSSLRSREEIAQLRQLTLGGPPLPQVGAELVEEGMTGRRTLVAGEWRPVLAGVCCHPMDLVGLDGREDACEHYNETTYGKAAAVLEHLSQFFTGDSYLSILQDTVAMAKSGRIRREEVWNHPQFREAVVKSGVTVVGSSASLEGRDDCIWWVGDLTPVENLPKEVPTTDFQFIPYVLFAEAFLRAGFPVVTYAATQTDTETTVTLSVSEFNPDGFRTPRLVPLQITCLRSYRLVLAAAMVTLAFPVKAPIEINPNHSAFAICLPANRSTLALSTWTTGASVVGAVMDSLALLWRDANYSTE